VAGFQPLELGHHRDVGGSPASTARASAARTSACAGSTSPSAGARTSTRASAAGSRRRGSRLAPVHVVAGQSFVHGQTLWFKSQGPARFVGGRAERTWYDAHGVAVDPVRADRGQVLSDYFIVGEGLLPAALVPGHVGEKDAHAALVEIRYHLRRLQESAGPAGDVVAKFRDAVGVNFLNYGAAYYPWLNTSILADSDVGFLNIDNQNLKDLLTAEGLAPQSNLDEIDKLKDYQTQLDAALDFHPNAAPNSNDKARLAARLNLLNSALPAVSPAYVKPTTEIKRQLNLLPPAAAMAGVYTMVDNTRGVWKAPANVSLNAVVSPAVNISSDDQEDLNVSTTGKSINAVRSFIGEGVLVWGARTLDGNSLDWRYICVRRTMIFLEQSIKLAAKAYVFDSNVSITWVTIKSMIRNFLIGIWQQGGLAGASPDDAFAVFCGLGETMTADDILDGILRVTVMVAVTRPAEFIEITFQQQMQKS
jgi:hypothetical protein